MLKRVLALLLLVPLVDALFLVYVATRIGAPLTVLLVVLTALIGMLLVRAEGRHTLSTIQSSIARGTVPTDSILDGGLLIAAGAFLLAPGLLTDALGFLLVLPPTRYPIRVALKRYVVRPYLDRRTGGFGSGNVYTFGFPNFESSGAGGFGDRGDESEDEDTYDVGPDGYRIDFDDDQGGDREPSGRETG